MKNSAALNNTTSTASYFAFKERAFHEFESPSTIRFPWTEELERRRRAVARWRGNDTGVKEAMMRDARE